MVRKVILLSNTFPIKGEPFLCTELELLPEGFEVDLWPFFMVKNKDHLPMLRKGIEPHFHGNNFSLVNIIGAALRSFGTYLYTGEVKAAFQKPNGFRNSAKALKFGYISELRVREIEKKLHTKGDVLLYSYWMYEVAYVAAKLKKNHPESRFVTRCHGYDLYGERHVNSYLPYRRFILNQADLVCPISDNGKRYLHDCFAGQYDDKISVMRLGTVRKAEILETQQKEEGIVLVSCSNLVEVKRVHLIISALKKCDRKVIWYHFGDGELRDSLERQAEKLPNNIRYKFMGYRTNEEVQRFYANHYIDAFVNVSKSEGIPVSVMEAESYGIPIIATDVGGTSEIVHDGENGVLLKVDFSDEDLLSAIENVLLNSEKYRVDALHTWQVMSDANVTYSDFYKSLEELEE